MHHQQKHNNQLTPYVVPPLHPNTSIKPGNLPGPPSPCQAGGSPLQSLAWTTWGRCDEDTLVGVRAPPPSQNPYYYPLLSLYSPIPPGAGGGGAHV